MPDTHAIVHLRGHTPTAARLRAVRVPIWSWAGRVARYVVGWLASTWMTLVFTFDPFVASFPFVIGMGLVYRTARGRYRVEDFQGVCPRCSTALELKPGSRIPLPFPLVCYACHHEPELRVGG